MISSQYGVEFTDSHYKGMEKGIAQGKKEGVKNAILNLMKNMKLSLEQAMEVLGIPEIERVEYMEMINRNRSAN